MKTNTLWIGAALLFLLFTLNACQLGRFMFYNFADIKDHKKFQSRSLSKSETPFTFYQTDSGRVPSRINDMPFEDFLQEHNTVAFLIIRNDTIQYENYFDKYTEESIVPSFSMAKSVTSILIGCAIAEGYIDSVSEPITRYVPELKENGLDNVTIRHLLQMTSGIEYNESYINPFGDAASFYYGLNLRRQIGKMKPEVAPGERFQYISGNTQLLGLILERALTDITITEYLQQKLWTPLAMEYDASWSIDRKKDGLEKTFCCINARARDYAKIGRLYLNRGNWNGEQIVPEKWVMESTQLDTADGSVSYYQYQWWLPTPGEDFMAEGILGQFIYVHPEKNLIMVRLGKNEGKTSWWNFFTAVAELY